LNGIIVDMGKIVLLRHGQSQWNKEDLFTGWVDIPLSSEGIDEAFSAGQKMQNLLFDVIFVSELVRAQMTAFLAMSLNKRGKIPRFIHPTDPAHPGWDEIHSEETKSKCIPVYSAWQLNERMYGSLQGLNKEETRKKYGADQVHIWRRSYDVVPPQGESLEINAKRTIPYFEEMILPRLINNETILISAHGNSLRAIVMYMESLTNEQVIKLEIPTGEPFAYTYKQGKFLRIPLDA
jgi:2,3-bisphosphoglycerate-dependent phosphoglycerate mutase